MKNRDIVLDGRVNAFTCLRCGKSAYFQLPMTTQEFVTLGKKFEQVHRSCRPTGKPIKVKSVLAHRVERWKRILSGGRKNKSRPLLPTAR